MADKPSGKIKFVQSHAPPLLPGDYEIKVQTDVKGVVADPLPLRAKPRHFSVFGPRFSLDPQDIHSVFPPAGSLGEHSSVLPYINFNRSTLPWERLVDGEGKKTPWLALLLFDATEIKQRQIRQGPPCVLEGDPLNENPKLWRLKASDADTSDKLISPTFTHEIGQHPGDQVGVIEVQYKLLKTILPTKEDAYLLAHVRQATDDHENPISEELPTLLCNRLPRPGSQSTVHLVSLEGGYGKNNSIWNLVAKDDNFIRLVSLHSWRFACVAEKHSFKGLLHHLNKEHLFDIDQELAKSLPGSMDEEPLAGEVRQAFIEKMSLAEGAEIRKLQASWAITDKLGVRYDIYKEAAGLKVYRNLDHVEESIGDLEDELLKIEDSVEVPPTIRSAIRSAFKKTEATTLSVEAMIHKQADAWQITDGSGKRYVIRKEGTDFNVLRNEKYLFRLTPELGGKLRVDTETTSVSKTVVDAFDHHLSVSKETTARLERDAWIIEDKNKHQRYFIRREKTRYLGVYENQKFLFELDIACRSKLPGSEKEQAIEKEIRDQFVSLRPLSKGANIRKEPAEAWRVTDPHGSDYIIRKNGNRYEVHRSITPTLRLPTNHLKQARPFVQQGYVPAIHQTRHANRTVSWYHSPLAPGETPESKLPNESLPARTADQLMRYNPDTGMFDVSYAAAWELGRLLTLQNESVAVGLLDWKRRHRHAHERKQAMRQLEHLPIEGQTVAADIPPSVTQWFRDLSLLEGLPFNYLVPDQRMLPTESIRFFWVDSYWVECLLDGAFSIGRVSTMDHNRDASHTEKPHANPHPKVTGFLLRSEVISGCPDLQVDGYYEAVAHENYEHPTLEPGKDIRKSIRFKKSIQTALNEGADSVFTTFNIPDKDFREISTIVPNGSWRVNLNNNEELYLIEKRNGKFEVQLENKLPLLRMTRLAPNVLFCLFAGDIKTVDIHQKPEVLHFGFNRAGEGDQTSYYRELKSHLGGELPNCNVRISWKGEPDKRVVAIKDLNVRIQARLKELLPNEDFRKAFKGMTSAQFALEMAEGVQKVRFVLG
jgi:hypothetical protein